MCGRLRQLQSFCERFQAAERFNRFTDPRSASWLLFAGRSHHQAFLGGNFCQSINIWQAGDARVGLAHPLKLRGVCFRFTNPRFASLHAPELQTPEFSAETFSQPKPLLELLLPRAFSSCVLFLEAAGRALFSVFDSAASVLSVFLRPPIR